MNFEDMSIGELEALRIDINKVLHKKREVAKNEAIIEFRKAFEEVLQHVVGIVATDYSGETELIIDDFDQLNFEE